jgi:hypothetical protein
VFCVPIVDWQLKERALLKSGEAGKVLDRDYLDVLIV